MKILLTNDDGIDAQGLNELAQILCKRHEVWIVAPLSNQSGTSNSIKMFKNLELQKRGPQKFALDGSPTDCVISGVLGNYTCEHFDVVISGINQGANLGTDLIYSGTCAAARQAAIFSLPGIALSVEGIVPNGGILGQGNLLYKPLAEFVANNLENLVSLCKKNQFLNINAPSVEKFKGIKVCSLSSRDYGDRIEISSENFASNENLLKNLKSASNADLQQNIKSESENAENLKIAENQTEKFYSSCIGGLLKYSGDENNDSLWVNKKFIALSLVDVYPQVHEVSENLISKMIL